jgi:hypothetical protein
MEEKVRFSETLANIYETTRRHILDDYNINNVHHYNLKYEKIYQVLRNICHILIFPELSCFI